MANAHGLAARNDIEARTDELSGTPWRVLGQARTSRLYGLVSEFSREVVRGGGLPVPNALGLEPAR